MLMPGRYISDTSEHCMSISTTKWVTTTNQVVAPYCLPCITWHPAGQINITPWSGTDTIALPIDPDDTTYGEIYTPISVTPGILNELHLSVDYISAGREGIRLAAYEDNAGVYKELTSTLIAGGRGDYMLKFTPAGGEVHITLANLTTAQLAYIHFWDLHKITYTTTTPVTVYETVCNEDKDKYRFGYNGKFKDNEVKGIGNSLDYGARWYDTRIARLGYAVDPLTKQYPSLTPYQFASNSPIQAIDLDGMEGIKYTDIENKTITVTVDILYVETLGKKSDNNTWTAKEIERVEKNLNNEINKKKFKDEKTGYDVLFNIVFKPIQENDIIKYSNDNDIYDPSTILRYEPEKTVSRNTVDNGDGTQTIYVGYQEGSTRWRSLKIANSRDGHTIAHELFHALIHAHRNAPPHLKYQIDPNNQAPGHNKAGGIFMYPNAQTGIKSENIDQQNVQDVLETVPETNPCLNPSYVAPESSKQ